MCKKHIGHNYKAVGMLPYTLEVFLRTKPPHCYNVSVKCATIMNQYDLNVRCNM